MSVHNMQDTIKDIYYSGSKIKKAYLGDTLVYLQNLPPQTILLDQTSPITNGSIQLKTKQRIRLILVGSGAGFGGSNADI